MWLRDDTLCVEVDSRMPEAEVLRLATSSVQKEFQMSIVVDTFKLSSTRYQVIILKELS